MSTANTLTVTIMLTQLLERAVSIGGLLRRAQDEGRGVSDEELAQLRAQDDAARAAESQAIADARARQGGRARVGLLAAVALLFAGLAWAATHTASWTKATTNTDGSAIPATGPGSVATTVEYGTCNAGAFGTKIGDVVAGSTGTSAVSPNLGPGTYCFRAKHTNTFGVDSDWTPAVQLVEAPPKPNPPSGLTIQ